MIDINTLVDLLKDRLAIGYSRYGKGLLHPDNDNLVYRQEAIEEALDLVIYASADAVRKTKQITMDMKLHFVNDEPRVTIRLKVNYELGNDGNDAVIQNIKDQVTKDYMYSFDDTNEENKLMLLGVFVLQEFLKKTPGAHA